MIRGRGHRARGLLFVLGAAIALAGTPARGAAPIALQPIVSGLAFPVAVTHAGDGSGRLFVTLRAGRIVIFDGAQVLPTPFLDITALTTNDGERGLFSVAFHPNYAANGLFYVFYTDLGGDLVIARYARSADPNQADPSSALILLTIEHSARSNHNGGQLQFGPDGFLYAGIGDGGGGGDPDNNGQDLGTLLGKLLRIDVDGGVPYAIPASNPFVGVPGARPEIWALGLRNPWRFSFDRLTGDLFIGDVGQNTREEVDFQAAGSAGGRNYCWRRLEGTLLFDAGTPCTTGIPTAPIVEYTHSEGCSITGGYRYRGGAFPQLAGTYFYGDLCSGRVWGADRNADGTWTPIQLLDTPHTITTFGEDQAGELYVAHFSATGALFRIVGQAPAPFAGGVYVAAGNLDGAGAAEIVTGAGAGGGPHVRAFNADGTPRATSFFAYPAGFAGGARVAACDFDGDGRAEIVTGAGPGGGPHVRVIKLDAAGNPVSDLASFFAYGAAFAGGVFVACGSVEGPAPAMNLVTGADAGGGPHVRVLRLQGGAPGGVVPVFDFFAYDAAFTGGVRVAAGDVNGDGRADIITAAGPGGGPHVRVFSGVDLTELASFFAYAPAFTGGVFVAAGDVTGDGNADVVTGADAGGGPHVRVFTGTGADAGLGFFAYTASFTGGVRVAAGNLDGAGVAELVTAPGPGGGPHVRGFSAAGGPTAASFFAY